LIFSPLTLDIAGDISIFFPFACLRDRICFFLFQPLDSVLGFRIFTPGPAPILPSDPSFLIWSVSPFHSTPPHRLSSPISRLRLNVHCTTHTHNAQRPVSNSVSTSHTLHSFIHRHPIPKACITKKEKWNAPCTPNLVATPSRIYRVQSPSVIVDLIATPIPNICLLFFSWSFFLFW
jgi:hypothetical protein